MVLIPAIKNAHKYSRSQRKTIQICRTKGFAKVREKGSASDGFKSLDLNGNLIVAKLDEPVYGEERWTGKQNPVSSDGDRGNRTENVEDGNEGHPEGHEDLGVEDHQVGREARNDAAHRSRVEERDRSTKRPLNHLQRTSLERFKISKGKLLLTCE